MVNAQDTQTAAPDIAAKVIQFATAQVGKPYRWGSTGPNSFDCSGLIYAAFRAAGKPFRFRVTTGTLRAMGTSVSRDQIAPGDLIFPDAGHVQIYLGNGRVVEAPHTGLNVRIVKMWGFAFARRLVPPTGAVTGAQGQGGVVASPAGFSVPNPLSGVGELTRIVGSWSGVMLWLVNPQNYLRVAMFTAGVVLLFVAIIGAERAGEVVKKGVSNAAST